MKIRELKKILAVLPEYFDDEDLTISVYDDSADQEDKDEPVAVESRDVFNVYFSCLMDGGLEDRKWSADECRFEICVHLNGWKLTEYKNKWIEYGTEDE